MSENTENLNLNKIRAKINAADDELKKSLSYKDGLIVKAGRRI